MSRSGKIIFSCMVILLLLMLFTQPTRLPPVMLAVPFVLIGMVIMLASTTAFRWQGFALSRSARLGAMCTSLPMLILVLQSLGQLTVRDLLTIVALFAIAYFYLSRVTKPSSE